MITKERTSLEVHDSRSVFRMSRQLTRESSGSDSREGARTAPVIGRAK